MIIYLNEIDSTNEFLKRNLFLPHYTFVSAKTQTKGKGRLERTWVDFDEEDIKVSFLLKKCANSPLLPLAVACVLHEAIAELIPSLKIKWPNDLIASDLKLAGILCEQVDNNFIVGFGINVKEKAQYDFPVTSLSAQLNRSISRKEVEDELIERIIYLLDKYLYNPKKIIKYVNNHLWKKGEEIFFFDYQTQKEMKGKIIKVASDGKIIIKVARKKCVFSSADLKIMK